MHLSVVMVTDIDQEENIFQNENWNIRFNDENPNCAEVVWWCATQPVCVLETYLTHDILKRVESRWEASSLCGMLHPVSVFQCDAIYTRVCSSDRKCKYKMPLISFSFPIFLKKIKQTNQTTKKKCQNHKRWGTSFKMCGMGRLTCIKKIVISY